MSRQIRTVFLAGGLGLLVLIATLGLLNRRDETVGLGTEIRYDDFWFSVLAVRRVDAVGKEGEQKPLNGAFYVVTLKVTNRARVVGFRFRSESAVLLDARGREHRPSPRATQALEAAEGKEDSFARELAPGASSVGELVYDVPSDLRRPMLRFSWGGALAEVLTFLFDGRKRIALE